jgi:FAD/FMN-containing dehydrogenase
VVPLDRLAELVAQVPQIGRRHGLVGLSFGHGGDGNMHSSFLVDPSDAARFAAADAARDELLALAIDLGGSISGEHGLGLVKSGRLAQQWNPAAVAAHAAIKQALDPKGLFNPGKKLGVWLQPDPSA